MSDIFLLCMDASEIVVISKLQRVFLFALYEFFCDRSSLEVAMSDLICSVRMLLW